MGAWYGWVSSQKWLSSVSTASRRPRANTVVVRPEGWGCANDVPETWTRRGYLYRGMTSTEYEAHRRRGYILSTGAYSHVSEGTCFSEDAMTAESYANSGRDDPRKTGRPTYLIEVKNVPELFKLDRRDYYYKAPPGVRVPGNLVTRVWKMTAKGDSVVATPIVFRRSMILRKITK